MATHNLILWSGTRSNSRRTILKKLFITLAIFLMSSMAYGEAKASITDTKETVTAKKSVKTEHIKKIKVHGMACPMCQSKAETKFKENKDIKSVDVDMDKMLITLKLHAGKDLSEKAIKPIVESLGLLFVEIVN